MFFDTLKNWSALRLFHGSSWMATPPAVVELASCLATPPAVVELASCLATPPAVVELVLLPSPHAVACPHVSGPICKVELKRERQ